MNPIEFRKYTELKVSSIPLIEGRIPSRWLVDHLWEISHEDFYNFTLSEDDLKKKYGKEDKP